jgi:hypothetical protein
MMVVLYVEPDFIEIAVQRLINDLLDNCLLPVKVAYLAIAY